MTYFQRILLGVLFFGVTGFAWAQSWPSKLEVGAHFGVTADNGELDDERVGVQATIGLIGPFEAVPAFSFFTNYPGLGSEFSGTAWQTYLTARFRPFHRDFPVAAGYGFTLARQTLEHKPTGDSDSLTDATDVAVIAVQVPVGRVRPFAELYLLDIFERKSAVTVNILGGVSFSLR